MPAPIKKCSTCKHQVPPRASHCRTYDRCVLKFDHWCPFACVAIGYHNYKQYCLLLIYGAWGSYVMLSYAHVPVLEYFWYNTAETITLKLVLGLILTLASCCVVPFCCALLFSHSFLVLRNMTTKEFFNFKVANAFAELPNDYNAGLLENLKQVFGPDWTMWWNPFVPAHPVGAGYKWVKRAS
eukprot:TRINITY_DN375_c0_g1_i3.p1 TRINITY_DN375_c0_g1~~TRINITY_DN375_c0_g1_i3.p1  ORF type:complete len:183 (+),score=14.27 TRINITY_DN375_c0_g1_i3:366-914(+)